MKWKNHDEYYDDFFKIPSLKSMRKEDYAQRSTAGN